MKTHDSPFEAEQYLANKEDWFRGSKEDDKEKAAHDTKSVEEYFAWTEGSNKPTIEDCTDDRSAACSFMSVDISKGPLWHAKAYLHLDPNQSAKPLSMSNR